MRAVTCVARAVTSAALALVLVEVARTEERVLARQTAHPTILQLDGRQSLSLKDGWKARRRSRDVSAEHPVPLLEQVQAVSSMRQDSCCRVARRVQLRGRILDFYQFRRQSLRVQRGASDLQSAMPVHQQQVRAPRGQSQPVHVQYPR